MYDKETHLGMWRKEYQTDTLIRRRDIESINMLP